MPGNYWRTKGVSLFTVPYVYVEHRDRPAGKLFDDECISVKYKYEMERAGSPYRIVFCRVRKRDTGVFEKAMARLKDNMLVFGYRDYSKVCEEIAEMINNEEENEKAYNT